MSGSRSCRGRSPRPPQVEYPRIPALRGSTPGSTWKIRAGRSNRIRCDVPGPASRSGKTVIRTKALASVFAPWPGLGLTIRVRAESQFLRRFANESCLRATVLAHRCGPRARCRTSHFDHGGDSGPGISERCGTAGGQVQARLVARPRARSGRRGTPARIKPKVLNALITGYKSGLEALLHAFASVPPLGPSPIREYGPAFVGMRASVDASPCLSEGVAPPPHCGQNLLGQGLGAIDGLSSWK